MTATSFIDMETIKNDIYWEMIQKSKNIILGGWQIKGSKYFYTNLMMVIEEDDEPLDYTPEHDSVGGHFSFSDSRGNFGNFEDCEFYYDGDISEMMEAYKKAKNWEEILNIEKFRTCTKVMEDGEAKFIMTGF